MTVQFIAMIDYAFDVADEGKEPLIGDCFQEMVEVSGRGLPGFWSKKFAKIRYLEISLGPLLS